MSDSPRRRSVYEPPNFRIVGHLEVRPSRYLTNALPAEVGKRVGQRYLAPSRIPPRPFLIVR